MSQAVEVTPFWIDLRVIARQARDRTIARIQISKEISETRMNAAQTLHVISAVRTGKVLLIEWGTVMQDACDKWKAQA